MNIDETISEVEKLYHHVTGQQMPSINNNAAKQTQHTNIDPIILLEMRLNELQQMIQDPVLWKHLQPWTPAMSVWESDEKIILRLDLPAVAKEDVDISLRGSVLCITGTRQSMPQINGFLPRISETHFGRFQRLVQLPIDNATPEISSSIKDGVLEITVHKTQIERTSKKNSNGKMQ